MSPRGGQAAPVRASSYVVRGVGLGWAGVAVMALHAPVAAAAPAGIAVAVAVILLSASAFRVPFRSDGVDGQDPAGAACMDARRFSTRQGCLVEKSRRRSGPSPRSGLGAEAGACFSWLLLFARAKRSNSLLRSRGESPAFKLLLSRLSHGFSSVWAAYSPPLARPLPSEPEAIEADKSRIKGFRSPSGREPPFFARAKKRGPKKHAPASAPSVPTALRGHSAVGIFRRDIPVSSKNDARPARRPSGFSRRLRRCGRGWVDQEQATARIFALPHLPASLKPSMRPTA